MERTLPSWVRALATTSSLVATGALTLPAQEQPAAANGNKFKVLVPSLERSAGARGNFGRDVAEELRKLIVRTPRHEPVDRKEMQETLRKFQLKEEDMSCIQNMQLALNMQAELVLCGRFNNSGSSFQLDSVQIISAKTQEAFRLQPITAASPKEAASQIFTQFEKWVTALQSASFCYEYLASQQWAQAIENCNAALAINPSSPRANAGKAFAIYSQAVAADPADQAKLTESLNLYKKVIETTVDQDALRMAGIIAARLGAHEESRGYFRQYLELNPGDAQVRLTIANEQAKAGDYVGALRITEEGLKADTANVDLLTWAGIYAAQAAFRENEAKKSESTPLVPEAKAHYETAIGYYDRLFTSKNGEVEPVVVRQYVTTLVLLARAPEAVEVGRRAAASNGKSGMVWASYAGALAEAGNLTEAVAAFDSAIARADTAETNLRARKANVVLRTGDLQAAKSAYQAALQAGEVQPDQVSDLIWRVVMNDKYPKKDWDGVIADLAIATEFAQASGEKAKLAFFVGLAYYQKGLAVGAKDAAAAKVALPHFQKALEYFDQSGPYAEVNPNAQIAQNTKAVRDYITYLNELIKRG